MASRITFLLALHALSEEASEASAFLDELTEQFKDDPQTAGKIRATQATLMSHNKLLTLLGEQQLDAEEQMAEMMRQVEE